MVARRFSSGIWKNSPLVALGALLCASLLPHCSGEKTVQPSIQASDTACTPATVTQDCELPHSVCSGASLVYYQNPSCLTGHCAFQSSSYQCSQGTCIDGACGSPITTVAPPPPGGAPNYAPCTVSEGGAAGDPGPGGCELPPSSCGADALYYYTNPRCVDGYCNADFNYTSCPYGCSGSACLPPSLTK